MNLNVDKLLSKILNLLINAMIYAIIFATALVSAKVMVDHTGLNPAFCLFIAFFAAYVCVHMLVDILLEDDDDLENGPGNEAGP